MILRKLPLAVAPVPVLADGLAVGVPAGVTPVGAGRMATVPARTRATAALAPRARVTGRWTALDGAVRRGRRLIASLTL